MNFTQLYNQAILTEVKKKHINDLTPEEFEEYKKIAILNNQGKFAEFEIAFKKFKKKFNIK